MGDRRTGLRLKIKRRYSHTADLSHLQILIAIITELDECEWHLSIVYFSYVYLCQYMITIIVSTGVSSGWAKMRLSEEITLPLNISQAALRRESDFGESTDQGFEVELIVDKLDETE